MTKHLIKDLGGHFLSAAVSKSMGFRIRIGVIDHNSNSLFGICQRLVHGSQGPKILVPDRWEQVILSWYNFGPILDREWRSITNQIFNRWGSDWRNHVDGPPGRVLTEFARAYVGSKHQDQDSIELPDPVHYKELE